MSTIPKPSDIKPDFVAPWRISSGKIHRTDNGSTEEVDALVGELKRIGFYTGINGTSGEPFTVFEIEIEAHDGLQTISLDAGRDYSAQLFSAARNLYGITVDDLIRVTCRQGTKKNAFGTFSTFVNICRIDRFSLKPVRMAGIEGYQDKAELEAAMRAHPAYSERKSFEAEEAEADMPAIDQFIADVEKATGKPFVFADHLTWIRSNGYKKVKTESDLDEADWADLRQTLANAKPEDLPKFDPFADE